QAPLADWVAPEVAEQARKSGYGNAFEAIRAYVPWRVALYSDAGAPLYPTPRPGGPLTATVVGPDGATSGSGAGEIHTDRLGRIRIRFDFQASEAQTPAANTSNASTWVRVMQRFAGAGMGWQFIPRVGQEVLVDFVDGQIERPIVIAALYNGQGEAGVPPTPGGPGAQAELSALARSSDHRPGAQGNRIGAGHSPAWHGAGSAAATAGSNGQCNASALNGIKTQEFGGSGHNQLVFDDSAGQLRVQLATTQHGTQLNLGHLIHQADNHRGSLRGAGFELRTDAYGVIRAASGVLLTTYGPTGTGGTPSGQATAEPALDNAAGIALAAQLKTLGQSLNQAAGTHQITQLAAQIGSGQAGQSSLAPEGAKPEATLAAWHTSVKGMVKAASFEQAQGDAGNKTTDTANTNVPASADPIIAIAAKAGWAQTAGQDVQVSAAENITVASGQDSHWATGGAYRLHTGQSIGMLAGAVQAGTEAAGKGITLIAAQGDTQIQAQSDTLQIAAKQQLSIQSETANIDWAAAKKITLATAGGASIVIEGGNITVMCPGTITVQAGAKSFSGPVGVSYSLPLLPKQVCVACLLKARAAGSSFAVR
ncbi:MAG: type VI secretion system Vgr family protein, partial [Hydrogenophaga sp.]|uniref:type VI secretion system Vgr family protein n=1 Tax=Hydrogenophaga sp. TaxID=1904254 RepID=UPI003D9B7C55